MVSLSNNTKKLIIELDGKNASAVKAIDEVQRKTDSLGGKLEKFKGLIVGSIVAGLGLAVKSAADFEKQFTSVVTLLDDSSFATVGLEKGIKNLEDGVKRLRGETGESFDKLNKGLFDLISAGVPAEQAISTLESATQLARAGATDTSVAVNGLTSVMNAYGIEADQAATISEKFFTAQKFGKTTVEELAGGFGKVGATANALGVSFDEVLASVSAVTLGGVKTTEAYTGLNAAFANVIRPTKEAADEAARLGIEFNSTALRAQGLDGFLKNITQSAGFSDTTMEKLFGSVEAAKIAMALAGEQGKAFENILKELGDETSRTATFQRALDTVNGTAAQKFAQLSGMVETLAVDLGSELLPALVTILSVMMDLITGIKDLNSEFEFTTRLSALVRAGLAQPLIIFNQLSLAAEKLRLNVLEARKAMLDLVGADTGALGMQIAQSEGNIVQTEGNLDFLNSQAGADFNTALNGTESTETGIEGEDIPDRITQPEAYQQHVAEQNEKELEVMREHNAEKEKVAQEGEDLLAGVRSKALAAIFKDELLNGKLRKENLNMLYDDLVSLAQSGSDELAAIGKAAAIAETIYSTYLSAQLQFEAFSRAFPAPIGQALGVAAAAAAVAAGIGRVSSIKGAAAGGIVGGIDTGRDNQMMAVRSGEMIVPSEFVQPLMPSFREAVLQESGVSNNMGAGSQNIEITLRGDAGRFIDARLRQDRQAGVI